MHGTSVGNPGKVVLRMEKLNNKYPENIQRMLNNKYPENFKVIWTWADGGFLARDRSFGPTQQSNCVSPVCGGLA